jgi:hypothetical protein
MKTIVTTLIICLTIQANAFTKKVRGNGNVITVNRTTSDYEQIKVGGSFDVTLEEGKEGELVIQIEDNLAEYLVTEVKDGQLKIRWEKGIQVRTKKSIKITIPFEHVNGVSLAGSGSIVTNDPIASHDLDLSLAGSGNMNIDVKAADLVSKIAGSGNMTVNGVTTRLECKIAGSGNFKGFELTTKDANAKIAGSGNVHATVNGKLTAKIAGSGSVKYEGNPTVEKAKIAGSGNVSRR